jgi:hypothetical protein
MKKEQLDVILARSGSIPLHLDITWPLEPGILDSISSPIECLQFCNRERWDSDSIAHHFKGLNWSTLRELVIVESCQDTMVFMDLALKSVQTDFKLDLTIGRSLEAILEHPLWQRITHFELDIGYYISIYISLELLTLPSRGRRPSRY